MSGSIVAKLGSISNEELMNHSLPSLSKKGPQFSTFAEMKSSARGTDQKNDALKYKFKLNGPSSFTTDSSLQSAEKFSPNKRFPVIGNTKKNIHVISKSKSTLEMQAQGSNFTPETDDTNERPTFNSVADDRHDGTFANDTFKEYYYQTMAGYSDGRTKTNQDTFYVNISVKRSASCSLFAVFDGHGPLGHKVSEFLKRQLTGTFW